MLLLSGSAFGGYASQVISYTRGTGGPPGSDVYDNPSAALGPPAPVIGAGTIYPNVLDPFSPAFGTSEIVLIGTGGQLTLQLDQPITVLHAPQLGVISNVGLAENLSTGTVDSPPVIFGGGTAEVRVSSNGNNWVSLGNVTFNLPASYFATLSDPYQTAPGPGDTPADLTKPYTGSLSDFAGKNFQQVMATLDGSVGGTWLNLAGTNLQSVQYVQFQNPSSYLAIDAITTSAVDVPEPAIMGVLTTVMAGLLARRRH